MYCETCDKYFIYEQTYQYIKKRGYICCRVIKHSELSMYNSGDFSTWKPKSILRLYGYSVEKSKGLTENERQCILAFLIENDILTISKIVSYLESFIILRRRNEKMQTAISKWRADIHYVLNYQKTNVNIRVNNIITKNY